MCYFINVLSSGLPGQGWGLCITLVMSNLYKVYAMFSMVQSLPALPGVFQLPVWV